LNRSHLDAKDRQEEQEVELQWEEMVDQQLEVLEVPLEERDGIRHH
jgi:hypothetical protein